MLDIINKLILVSELPKKVYKINVYAESSTYNLYDTGTGIVEYSENVLQSCGCCSGYEPNEDQINDLDELIQCEILIEMYDMYCTPNP